MNYSNPYVHVTEAERNNILIKERFRIAYYWLPYKNISRIMVRHLAINVKRNLNLFPVIGVVLDYYIPHMILSQSNWYYKKYFQVAFSSYVQASQVDDPNNTNHLRTLDEIYLCLAPNFQGIHQITELRMGQFIK